MNAKQEINNWKMYRAKFFNFWYYPDQEFYFKDGCAVLRGHNGSGKSVTTQSLITVLLDGDVRSYKLDPFGGRDRNIKDTVLGEENLVDINERIAYLLLEFKKENSEIYKTIGMGIEAIRKNRHQKVWYFIVDGPRFGDQSDFLKLYKEQRIEGKTERIPLDDKQFRHLIETIKRCGRIYTDRDDYADKVNKHLFGFDTLDSYKGLMDLLRQLRSPKLSDNSKPEGVADVINDSLPQLSDSDLRPLTDSIESIDRIERDLKDTKRYHKSMKVLSDVFIQYSKVVLVEKATEFSKASTSLDDVKLKIAQAKKQVMNQRDRLEEIDSEERKLSNQLEVKKEYLSSLNVTEIEEIESRKQDEEGNLQELTTSLKSLNDKLEVTIKKKQSAQNKRDTNEADFYEREKEFKTYLQELDGIAESTDFDRHKQYIAHLLSSQHNSDYSFSAWRESVRTYIIFLENIKKELVRYENLREKLGRIDNELGELQMKIDVSNSIIEDCHEKIENELINLLGLIQEWSESASCLNADEDTISQLLYRIEGVYDDVSEDDYFAPLKRLTERRKDEVQTSLLDGKHQQRLLEIDKLNTEREIKELENKEEIEPFFVAGKKDDWNKLLEAGVEFIPFYEAYEFHEGIDEADALKYQHALMESGILASVIVSRNDIEDAKKYTTILEYGEQKKNNLLRVLKSSHGSELNELLTSISIEESNGTYVLASGSFKSGLVKGKASRSEDSLFIGKAAREAYRNNKITELVAVKNKLGIAIRNQKETNDKLEDTLVNIQSEYESFPSLTKLAEKYNVIDREKRTISEMYEPTRQALSEQYSEVDEEGKRILAMIKTKLDYSKLDLTVEAFDTELRGQNDYANCLQDIQLTFTEKVNSKTTFDDYKERCQEFEEEEVYIRQDIVDNEFKVNRAEETITNYEKRLQRMGSEDVLNLVRELKKDIGETIPQALGELREEEFDLQRDVSDGKMFIERHRLEELPFRTIIYESWEKEFQEHYNLGYLTVETESHEPIIIANELLQKHASEIRTKQNDLDGIKNKLTKTFNNQQLELVNYELEMQTRQSEHIPDFETDDENKRTSVTLITGQMSRIAITMNVDGDRVPPPYAVKHLENRIERLEVDIGEKDRDLYERILVNTLGDTIRKKIRYVQEWEKEMNKFMEHENFIKFRLKWSPKKKENDKQLDTSKLVELLKKDSQWIDISEISNHFRSKIKMARRRHERQTHKELNLRDIMREELDYRKWYEIEIYFQKQNDKEMKLTRNTYGELSGGQRVLAMITPVLAALYAKYSEANVDCPRIFTLDEAFSRVDEENIDIMFAYIRKLGFNYILNSQSLWGCFESVPSLNIYELSRPGNMPHVLIESYYWNGNIKVREKTIESEEKEIVTII